MTRYRYRRRPPRWCGGLLAALILFASTVAVGHQFEHDPLHAQSDCALCLIQSGADTAAPEAARSGAPAAAAMPRPQAFVLFDVPAVVGVAHARAPPAVPA